MLRLVLLFISILLWFFAAAQPDTGSQLGASVSLLTDLPVTVSTPNEESSFGSKILDGDFNITSFQSLMSALQPVPAQDIEVVRQDFHLAAYGLYRQPIIGDGNCLFRAISYSLYGHEDNHLQLRYLAVDTLSQNIDLFRNYFYADEANPPSNYIINHLNSLRQPGTFAGQECVLALAKALNINIIVTLGGDTSTEDVVTIENTFDQTNPQIHIVWTRSGGGHYEAISETPQSSHSNNNNIQQNDLNHIIWQKVSSFSKPIDLQFKNTNLYNNEHDSSVKVHNYSDNKHSVNGMSKNSANDKICQVCKQKFATNYNLKRHLVQHQKYNDKSKLSCMLPSCDLKFSKIDNVIHHAIQAHDADIKIEHLNFENENDFNKYKEKQEAATNTRFVKKRQPKLNKQSIKTLQLVCHRDGSSKPHLKRSQAFKGKRKNKKGQCKIDGLCPARMYVKFLKDKSLKVKYIRTHSHSLSFSESKYLKIPKSTQEEIATMLSLEMPIFKILDKIRLSFASRDDRDNLDNLKHFHLIDRKTIHNIKKRIIDSSVIRHSENATSVSLRVHALRSEKFDPVLIYKKQSVIDLSSGLEKDDFMLALMTNQQLTMYKKFANRIICMDSTHNTNQYGFKLITLLVPDEFRRGYPVAFCLTNKESEDAVSIFLNKVRNCAPEVHISLFMTDDDNAGWNAIRAVFGKDVQQYLCVWHVHKNWRRKLQESIKEKHIQTEIYAFLCAMLEAKTEAEYIQYRRQLYTKYGIVQKKFVDYFKNNYDVRNDKWALFHRTKREYANTNTNMFVESFHNKLKTLYFGKKRNRRIDVLIETLLQIENHIYIDHFKRTKYDLPADYDLDTWDRHSNSLNIPDSSVTQVNEQTFTVLSSNTKTFYSVSVEISICKEEHCYVKCRQPPCLNLCFHMYSCSCEDYKKGDTICKHVHKVHSLLNKASGKAESLKDTNAIDLFTSEDMEQQQDSMEGNKQKIKLIREMLSEISEQIERTSVQKFRLDSIQTSLKNIISANNGCDDLESTDVSLKRTDIFPSNAKNILQPRFKPYKKKSTRKNVSLKAPTEEEKKKLLAPKDQTKQNKQSAKTQTTSAREFNLNNQYIVSPSSYNTPIQMLMPDGRRIDVVFSNSFATTSDD